MFKKFYTLICFSFLCCSTFSQSVTIKDDAHKLLPNSTSSSPYNLNYEYSYAQTIYLENEIQAEGTITALTYYFNGANLSHSDSLNVYIGKTNFDNLDKGINLIKDSAMKMVFKGTLSNPFISGSVTITLDTPFYYNGDSNLVIAVNELRAGSDTGFFSGFLKRIHGYKIRTNCVWDLNPINVTYVQSVPPQTFLSPSGNGTTADITIHGLTKLPCQSPQNVRFGNINDHSTRISWSPPDSGIVPPGYDVYFDTSINKPANSISPDSVNISGTQLVLNNLAPGTKYYAWVRSNCGLGNHSVYSLIDSFSTACTPTLIPTPAEPFDIFLPNCWSIASGKLNTQTQFTPLNEKINNLWHRGKYLNQGTGTNFCAKISLLYDSSREWLMSPAYNLGTSGNKNLEFDVALTKYSGNGFAALFPGDVLAVVVAPENGGYEWSSNNVVKIWYNGIYLSNTGTHITVPLNAYSGPVRVGFYVQRDPTTNAALDLFIDNVQVTGLMPVTLLSFTGQKQDNRNLLQWRTATEQNNRGFELQRSTSGTAFRSIAFVPTKANGGNSTGQLIYQFADKKPLASGSYYRLKQVDFDGKSTLSNVVFIKGDNVTELSISGLYPNPTQSQLNVVLQSPTTQKVELVISDIAGKVVQQQTLQLQKGENNNVVNVAGLAKGIYVVKVVCANGCESVSKFVKE